MEGNVIKSLRNFFLPLIIVLESIFRKAENMYDV